MLIGICGKKNVGKSTAAGYLKRVSGFRETAFADPIKRALAAMYGVSVSIFYDQDLKEVALPELFGRTPRFLMQTLGTEWGRDVVSETLWVDLLLVRLGKMGKGNIVVSDVRKDNEALAVINSGGVIWEIDGPRGGTDNHKSESGVSAHLIDCTLVNDGSKVSYYKLLGDTLEQAMARPNNGAIVRTLPTV